MKSGMEILLDFFNGKGNPKAYTGPTEQVMAVELAAQDLLRQNTPIPLPNLQPVIDLMGELIDIQLEGRTVGMTPEDIAFQAEVDEFLASFDLTKT